MLRDPGKVTDCKEASPSILRSTIYSYGAAIVYFASGVISNIIISRWCGPAILGEYFFIITLSNVITNFAALGIGFSNSTFLARKEHSFPEMNFVSLFFSISIGIICILLFYLLKWTGLLAFSTGGHKNLGIAVLALPLTIYMRYWNTLMIGQNKIPSLSRVISYSSLFWSILIVIAVFSGRGLEGLFAAWIAYLICTAFYMAILAAREGGGPAERGTLGTLLRKSLSFGFRGSLGDIATELWKKMDVFLLYHFAGVASVGIYSVAATIIDKFNQVATPLRIAITPRISGEGMEKSSEITEKAGRQILISVALFAVLLIVLAREFIARFYGATYLPSVLPLRILCVGAIGGSLAGVLSIFFVGQLKRPGLLSLLAWINVILNLVLCLVLIPIYGSVGAALSTSITTFLGTVILVLIYGSLTGNSIGALLIIRLEDIREIIRVILRRLNKA